MARKRSALGIMLSRAWERDRLDLLAREKAEIAKLPPIPDPVREPRAHFEWLDKYGLSPRHPAPGWPTPEWLKLQEERRALFEAARELPGIKYRRARDDEVWSWIRWLLAHQAWGAYDLATCSLGANPANPNARPSKMLLHLTAIVAREYPTVDTRRLYDAIRNWRKRRRSVSTIAT